MNRLIPLNILTLGSDGASRNFSNRTINVNAYRAACFSVFRIADQNVLVSVKLLNDNCSMNAWK